MISLAFNTTGTNVELKQREIKLVAERLAPLGRLVNDDADIVFDTAVRRLIAQNDTVNYFVSVRLTASGHTYYAVATEPYLPLALSRVRDDLRKAISFARVPVAQSSVHTTGYTLVVQ